MAFPRITVDPDQMGGVPCIRGLRMAEGLVAYYTLFVIDIATRAVHIAGTTPNPDSAFMVQVARNLTDCFDGFLRNKRLLILDRDTKFCAAFRNTLRSAGVKPVVTSYLAPNLNAFAERFVLSAKSECLEQMIFFGERSLRRALAEFAAHYHGERPHQGLGNQIIHRGSRGTDAIEVRERLGGLLKHYHRAAA